MSNAVDTRIVELQFDNQQFQKEVGNSVASLKNLDNQLLLKNGDKGFSQIQSGANKLDMSGVQKQTGLIESALLKMKDVGVGVFSSLTSAAGLFVKGASLVTGVLNTGVVAKSIQGGWNRASNIGKARFQLQGLGVEWDAIKEDLNYAVDNTAYGLDAAAITASSLVASGVQIGDEMKTALRAVSGVAAMTSREYGDIGSIFSTVAGQGQLMTMQLRQLEASGLNGAAKIAEYLREVRGETDATEASVREMVTDGKVDFKMFADAMYWAFGEHAVKANETFSGAMANMNAALSRTTADFFEKFRGKEGMVPIFNDLRLLINDLNKQTSKLMHTWTDDEGSERQGIIISRMVDGLGELHKALTARLEDGGFVATFGKMLDAMTPNINAFASFINKGIGSFTNLAFDIGEVFMTIATVAQPVLTEIGRAFAEVFGGDLMADLPNKLRNAAQEFKAWVESMAPTPEQLIAIHDGAKKAFEMIKKVTDVIGDFSNAIFHGFMDGGKAINEWFQNFVDKSKDGEKAAGALSDKIKESFGIGITAKVKNFFAGVKDGIANMFKDESGKPIDFMEAVTNGIDNAWKMIHKVLDPQELSQVVNSIMSVITPILGVIMQFRGADMMNKLSLIPDKLLNQMKTVTSIPVRFGEILTSISAGITRLTRATARKQSSEALVNYAKAIGILAASLIGLSLVDPTRLMGAILGVAALGLVLAMMTSIMERIAKLTKLSQALDMGVITSAMIPMTIAIDLVSIAVAKLATIPTDRLDTGINAVFRLMLFMAIFAGLLSGLNTAGMFSASVGLVVTAAALLVMYQAMKQFASFDSGEFEDGLNRAAFALVAMAGAMFIASSASGSAIKAALGMGIMILALNGFLMLLRGFATIEESTIQKTLGTLAAVLIGLGVAVAAFSSDTMRKGAGNLNAAMGSIGMMAIVLNLIAFAISNVMNAAGGNLEILITTLVGLAGVIIVMSVALELLAKGSVAYEAGAASLLIMSAALLVMAKTITVLEAIPWLSLISSFLKLGAAIVVLAALGMLADGLAAPLLSLAVVLGALSLALLTGSAAVFLFAQALQIIATLGGAAVETMIYTLMRIANAISENRAALVNAAAAVGEAMAAAFIAALKTIIMGIGDILATAIPAISSFLTEHGDDIVNIGVQMAKLIATGFGKAITEIPKMLFDLPAQMNNIDAGTQVEFTEYGYNVIGQNVTEGVDQAAEEIAQSDTMPQAVADNAEKAGEEAKDPMAASLTDATNSALEEASANANPDSFDLSNIFSEGGMNLDALSDSLLGDAEGIGGGLSDSLLKGAGDNPIDIGSLTSKLGMDEGAMGGMFESLGSNMGSMFSGGLEQGFGGDEGGGAVNQALDSQLEAASGRAEEFRAPGQMAGESYGAGMSDGISATDLSGATGSTITQMNAAASQAQAAGNTVGGQFGAGEAVGIVRSGSTVTGAASSITNSAKWGAGGYGAGSYVGDSFGSGMASGIYSKSGAVAAAAVSIVKSALDAAKKEADSHSPSKKMIEQGENFGEGYSIGIANCVGMVSSAASAMVSGGLDAVEGTILNTQSLFDGIDWDNNPVITPVLDLSQVERGLGVMDGMFSHQTSIAAHADRIFDTVGAQNQNGGDTNIEVHLNWEAGVTANQMAQKLAEELSLYRATEGK